MKLLNVFHRKTNIGIRKDGGNMTGLIVNGVDVCGDGLPDVDALFGGVDCNVLRFLTCWN